MNASVITECSSPGSSCPSNRVPNAVRSVSNRCFGQILSPSNLKPRIGVSDAKASCMSSGDTPSAEPAPCFKLGNGRPGSTGPRRQKLVVHEQRQHEGAAEAHADGPDARAWASRPDVGGAQTAQPAGDRARFVMREAVELAAYADPRREALRRWCAGVAEHQRHEHREPPVGDDRGQIDALRHHARQLVHQQHSPDRAPDVDRMRNAPISVLESLEAFEGCRRAHRLATSDAKAQVIDGPVTSPCESMSERRLIFRLPLRLWILLSAAKPTMRETAVASAALEPES